MMQIRFLTAPNPSRSLWHKVLAFLFTTMLVLLALTFSAVLLLVVLVFGALAWAYLWWKTRALRKQLRNFAPRAERSRAYDDEMQGGVMEGEVTRVDVS